MNEIKRNENLKRIFGKRELKIIEKQLLGVKLKPSEIVRLSRDIRKKFDAVNSLSKYSGEFELKKGADVKEIIQEAIEIIRETPQFPQIKRILLFGSAVENQLTLMSDVDIAVEFEKVDENEAGMFRKHILGRVNKRVDIQVYNVLPEKIKKEIDNKGKILYKK